MVIRYQNDATTTNEYFIKTHEAIYTFNLTGGGIGITNSKCKSFESVTITNGVPATPVRNGRFNENNIIEIHRKIYERWTVAYDNSYLTNIFYQAPITNQRTVLQSLV